MASQPGGATVSWGELRDEASARLGLAGVESAASEARWLVEESSGYAGADHLLQLAAPATTRGVAHLDAMLARRLAGEPIQYVLGHWPFRTLDLAVDRRVLIPRPETETVAGYALEEFDRLARQRPLVVDLGTGTGAIALSVAAERSAAQVWASDRSTDALAVARANLSGLGTFAAPRVRLVHGDWYQALPEDLWGQVGVIVSNPPYVADGEELPSEVASWEPVEALRAGPVGLDAIEVVVAGAPDWLAEHGSLVVEIGETQGIAAIGLAHAAGFDTVEVRPDLAGRDRALVARR